MSPASQSKVREQAEFEVADVSKDCVMLWTMIKSTHLTNINGAQAPMVRLHKRDQMARYNPPRQGDREYVASFKIRYYAQVQAGVGAGLTALDEETMAMDFLHKLDQKRFGKLLTHMRRNALLNNADAYPATLAAAVTIASD